MAKNPRRRPTHGPARDTPRARTVARPQSRTRPAANSAVTGPAVAPQQRPHGRLSSRITGRAVALIVTVALLTLSYATSLRVWLDQRAEIAETKTDFAQTQQRITALDAELKRWKDPEYVKAQARSRLGWVVPGETGYRVIGPDGKPLAGGAVIGTDDEPAPATESWYAKVWGSAKTADAPRPKPTAKPQPEKTIGPEPSASPQPKKRSR